MEASERDMSALREAQQQLSTRISRFALIRLVVLVVLVFTFSHSFEQVQNSTELIDALKQYPIGGRTWSRRRHSARDDFSGSGSMGRLTTPEIPTEQVLNDASNRPSPVPSVKESPMPAGTAAARSSVRPSPSVSEKPSATPSVKPSPTPLPPLQTTAAELNRLDSYDNSERGKAERAGQKKEIEEGRDLLRNAFKLDLSIQGFKIVLDLRIWVYFLPFLFLISEVYLQIQREKRKLLAAVATSNVNTVSLEADESISSETSSSVKHVRPTTLDMLVFSKNAHDKTPFSQHPAQFEEILYTSGVVIAVIYMLLLGRSFWALWATNFQIMYLQILVTFICWAVAYYRYVSKALERQVLEVTGLQVTPGWAARIWNFGNQKAQTVIAIVKKRTNVSLVTGSLLVLATLFLTTASSCDGPPKQGYQLALGQEDAWWFTVVNLAPTDADTFKLWRSSEYVRTLQFMGRAAYITGLIVALVSLVLIFFRSTFRSRVSFWLFVLSGTVILFVITDSSFALADYNEVLFLMKTGCLLVALCLWYGLGLPNTQSKAKWQKARRVLIAFYVPLVVNACISIAFTVRYQRLWGLLWFFLGSAVLCLTHMQLKKAVQEDSVAGESSVRPAPVEALSNTS